MSTPAAVASRSGRGRLGQIRLAGRIDGGRGVPGHRLRTYPSFALTYVSAGRGRYQGPAARCDVTPGTLILVHPGVPHWYGTDGTGWDETYVVFEGPVFELAVRTGLLDPARPVHPGLPPDRWLGRFDAFRHRRRPATGAGLDAEAFELLALVTRAIAEAEVASSSGSSPGSAAASPPEDWFARSVRLLQSDLEQQLPMVEVAAAVGVPYETWRRRFRGRAGEAPHAFRARHRLETARELVEHTMLGTRDIAASLGFSDERHLIRRFRAEYGSTPRGLRERSG